MWRLISDPGGFAIDHWPSLAIIAFLISCIWLLPTYMALLKSRITWGIVGAFALVAVTWSVRGRWDDDQFAKERASWSETLHQIDDANTSALTAALQHADEQRTSLKEIVKGALKEAKQEDPDLADAQKQIDAMPNELPAIVVSKDCPHVPPVDPVLQRILRGKP